MKRISCFRRRCSRRSSSRRRAGADTKTVQITKTGFTPSATTVIVGDSVTWHNADTVEPSGRRERRLVRVARAEGRRDVLVHVPEGGKVTYHDSFATSHKGTVTATPPAANVTLTTRRRRSTTATARPCPAP